MYNCQRSPATQTKAILSPTADKHYNDFDLNAPGKLNRKKQYILISVPVIAPECYQKCFIYSKLGWFSATPCQRNGNLSFGWSPGTREQRTIVSQLVIKLPKRKCLASYDPLLNPLPQRPRPSCRGVSVATFAFKSRRHRNPYRMCDLPS